MCIRDRGVAHVMKAPLGFFDSNASGLIRGRLDAAAADTETLLAHNLADIVGTITLFIAMLVMAVVGLVTIYVKQRGGLHNKRRAKGIYVYKNLRRNS